MKKLAYALALVLAMGAGILIGRDDRIVPTSSEWRSIGDERLMLFVKNGQPYKYYTNCEKVLGKPSGQDGCFVPVHIYLHR